MSAQNDLKASILSLMSTDSYEFVMESDQERMVFSKSKDISEGATASFFGQVNRALREYCIKISEYITMTKRHGFIPAFLAFWDEFETNLFTLAEQIGKIFEEKTEKDVMTQPGLILYRVRSQILHFGHINWKRYVLNQRFIAEELPSDLQLIEESPAYFPFNNFNFGERILSILAVIPDKDFRPIDFYLAKIIAQYLKLFPKHTHCYPPNVAGELADAGVIADTLYVYMRFSPTDFVRAKRMLVAKMKDLANELKVFKPAAMMDGYSLFDNFEYIRIMKMMNTCDPEEYARKIIPSQIQYISKIGKPIGWHPDRVLPNYKMTVLPMFESALAIIRDNRDAVRSFYEKFCERMFPLDILSPQEEVNKLFGERERYLHCVWRMTNELPQYVIILSNAFIAYYKGRLHDEIRKGDEIGVQTLVAKINGLVDGVFNHHPTMVLARSQLFIPHQKDSDLVGRARVLVEQAHNPSRLNYSVAELFDIVPFVRNRRDLFKGISDFVQNQLLAQVDPSVELERTLIDSMGQYTETEYIAPLQAMLKEFAARYDDFNRAKRTIKFSEHIRIAVLSNMRWKSIVQRGDLFQEDEFRLAKENFAIEFNKTHRNSHLIWCDPASVVEVQMIIDGRPLLFLFNGVQFAIMKKIIHGPCTYNDFLKDIPAIEDLREQLATLVDNGLLTTSDDKNTYSFVKKFDHMMYRNFAKKYTSAENIALIQMKENDKRKAIDSIIVREVKQAGRTGLTMADIVKRVQAVVMKRLGDSLNPDIVREQTRVLEITKFIKFEPKLNVFVFTSD